MDTYANTPEERIAILEKIRQDPSCLKDLNESILADKTFMVAAVKSNPDAMNYAPKAAWSDPDILFEVLKNDPSAILKAPPELQAKYAEEGISAFNPSPIRKIGDAIQGVLDQFRSDDGLVIKRKLPTPFDTLKPTPYD